MWMLFDAMGPGLLFTVEEIWKEVWEHSAAHCPPAELQALCTTQQ